MLVHCSISWDQRVQRIRCFWVRDTLSPEKKRDRGSQKYFRWTILRVLNNTWFTASWAYSTWWRRPWGDHTVTSVSYWLRNICFDNNFSLIDFKKEKSLCDESKSSQLSFRDEELPSNIQKQRSLRPADRDWKIGATQTSKCAESCAKCEVVIFFQTHQTNCLERDVIVTSSDTGLRHNCEI